LALRAEARVNVVTDTNGIAEPMQRVMEDIRSHYEVAIPPSPPATTGDFGRSNQGASSPCECADTKRILALPDLNGSPLQPFEATALDAINARPAPEGFPSNRSDEVDRDKQFSIR
jgi:hypothetical protein